MKLNYKNYPALIAADNKMINKVSKNKDLQMVKGQMMYQLHDPETTIDEKNLIWTEYMIWMKGLMLNKPIFFISDSFFKAVEENENKIGQLIDNDSSMLGFVKENSIYVTKGGYVVTTHMMNDDKQLFIIQNSKGETIYTLIYNHSEDGIKVYFSADDDIDFCIKFFRGLLKLILFKKFATVELEVVEPGKKKQIKWAEHGKVINEMGIEVTMLDSSWFREIIRREGFKVRGHFRLQPCKDKDGNWTRKIIYINEFEKHGYHRKARIENITDCHEQN